MVEPRTKHAASNVRAVLCVLVASLALGLSSSEYIQVPSKEAFATVLFGKGREFLLGVRVLGQSLKEVGSKVPMVALCTPEVPIEARNLLRSEGWMIRLIDNKDNLYKGNALKLLAWTVTEYDKLALIDSDAIVINNIDDIFQCGNFCVGFRHSDNFNTGVMVLSPSLEIDHIMRSQWNDWFLKTRSAHDQPFMNKMALFQPLKYASMYNPHKPTNTNEYRKLPFGYNMDMGVYYMLSSWRTPPDDRKVLHYTLGPVKPWKWWSYPFFDLNWQWNDLRNKLLATSSENHLLHLYWMPTLLLLVCGITYWICSSNVYRHKCTRRCMDAFALPSNTIHTYFPTIVSLGSSYLAFKIVPMTVQPFQGWFIFIEWFATLHILFYSLYGHFVFKLGQQSESTTLRNGGQPKPVKEGISYLLILVSIYCFSLIALCYIPLFSTRVKAFICLITIFYVFDHYAGKRIIQACFVRGLHSRPRMTV